MKTFIKGLMAGAMVFALTACGSSGASSTTEPAAANDEMQTAAYTFTNVTGEKVTDLYLYETGASEKGDNLAGEGMEDGGTTDVTFDLPKSEAEKKEYTVEFTTESGYTGTFGTLHFEQAPIYLISADQMTGATMISFMEPSATAAYTIYNQTGEKVTDLYLYETGAAEKGENLAGEGLAADESYDLTFDLPLSESKTKVYTIEFTTESGYTGTFDTLHFEQAPISLISADAMTGATMIKFAKPE